MNSGVPHAPGAGSIARPVDLQSHSTTTAQIRFIMLYVGTCSTLIEIGTYMRVVTGSNPAQTEVA